MVNFPHNPTGYLPTVDEYLAIIELARERGIYLLSDEMYRFLEIAEGTTLPSACEHYQRAFSLFGLSKSFGLPGLRIGWVATRQEDILERMAGLKDYTTICSSAPSEILAIIALRNRTRIIGEQLQRVRRNAAVLDKFFDENTGLFNWNRPLGGSICFPRVLVVDDTHSFCERLVQESGIMLAPSRIFEYGDQHVRIGFGREDLPQVLGRFGDYLEGRFCLARPSTN